MDAKIAQLLEEMEQRWQREMAEQARIPRDEAYARVDEFLLPVGPETGRFMNDLIKAGKFRAILEVGSSYGYSTIWLAEAARTNGGKVVSLELHAGKIAAAKAALASVGLSGHAEFVHGDALQAIEMLPGPFDFVLIDLWKELYVPCFDKLHPKLSPGAILVADNMIFPPEQAAHAEAYRARVRSKGNFDSVLLPIGAGIEVSRSTSFQ